MPLMTVLTAGNAEVLPIARFMAGGTSGNNLLTIGRVRGMATDAGLFLMCRTEFCQFACRLLMTGCANGLRLRRSFLDHLW